MIRNGFVVCCCTATIRIPRRRRQRWTRCRKRIFQSKTRISTATTEQRSKTTTKWQSVCIATTATPTNSSTTTTTDESKFRSLLSTGKFDYSQWYCNLTMAHSFHLKVANNCGYISTDDILKFWSVIWMTSLSNCNVNSNNLPLVHNNHRSTINKPLMSQVHINHRSDINKLLMSQANNQLNNMNITNNPPNTNRQLLRHTFHRK